jgi:mono/diheme cytochrome c family protein/rhodanese-related sulfurtransferase
MQAAEADYQRYCALCHGADRAGHANDHAPSLKSRSLLESGYPTVLGEAIAYGRPGTPMGGYLDEVGGPLERAQVRRLVGWLMQVEGMTPQPMGFAPVTGDAARGGDTYAKECAGCHGAGGEGDTGTALANPAMLALTPDGFLRHAIVHGRDGTPMPAFAGTLSDAAIDDVTAFLRSRGGDGAGAGAGAVVLADPPAIGEWILNPAAPPPQFELADGLYVSAAQLDRELRAGKRMVLLDTRVTSMWQLGHIAGAAPLPYYSSPSEVIAGLPRDGTWIVAYCECPRAAAESVVRRLRDQGFANTAVLYEGIQGWVALGYPVVGGNTQ